MTAETDRRDELATEELVNHLDQDVGELEAITRTLLYIAETAEPEERNRLLPSVTTMLYLMLDRANDASRMLGKLHSRVDQERPVNAPCDKTLSHASFLSHMFSFRSKRRSR